MGPSLFYARQCRQMCRLFTSFGGFMAYSGRDDLSRLAVASRRKKRTFCGHRFMLHETKCHSQLPFRASVRKMLLACLAWLTTDVTPAAWDWWRCQPHCQEMVALGCWLLRRRRRGVTEMILKERRCRTRDFGRGDWATGKPCISITQRAPPPAV